jgi:sulfane dehydrogenase subunit SoxC
MDETSRMETEQVAGNGLLHRRMFLASGVAALGSGALADTAAATPLPVEPWMQIPGSPFVGYGQPSHYEQKVARTWASAPGTGGTGSARTPHHLLTGMITPSGLHYERSHSGIPDIDPAVHRFVIHGLVKRPLVFTLDDLGRYPMESRIVFLECAGNSGALFTKEPAPANIQAIHGLLSCQEWTGIRLATLLQEAGVAPEAKWALAEGADAAGMSRSFPLEKAMDDAIIALYQNGERVRPSNGYPMRLLLPGWEGNMNVK